MTTPTLAAESTYQMAEWLYRHADGIAADAAIGLTPQWSCMLTRAVPDMSAEIQRMREQGYHVHSVTVQTFCLTCEGSGRVRKLRSRALNLSWKPCPTCKGHDGPLSRESVDVSAVV